DEVAATMVDVFGRFDLIHDESPRFDRSAGARCLGQGSYTAARECDLRAAVRRRQCSPNRPGRAPAIQAPAAQSSSEGYGRNTAFPSKSTCIGRSATLAANH